jgi:hypothetical protein
VRSFVPRRPRFLGNKAAPRAKPFSADDATFARDSAAVDRLAEGLCKAIEKAGKMSPEAEGRQGAAPRPALRSRPAREGSAEEEGPDQGRPGGEGRIVHQYANTKEATETSESPPDVYRALRDDHRRDPEDDGREGGPDLQREGEQVYSQAEDKAKTRLAELDEDHSSPANERLYTGLRYNLPRTYYYHSLLFPRASGRRRIPDKAVDGFQQFGLDNRENPSLRRRDPPGTRLQRPRKNGSARPSFDETATALAAQFTADNKGVFQISPEIADTVSGVLQKVLFQTELKDYRVRSRRRRFFTTIPDPQHTRAGPPCSRPRPRRNSPRAT